MSSGPARRVVSLVPSATETLIAWGVTPIAVTRFCLRPELPAVGGTKDPDVAKIVGLEPDLVVMCEEENRVEDAIELTAAGVPFHTVRVHSVADVEPALDALADAVGVHRRVAGEASPARRRSSSDRAPVRLHAFIPIWRRPWMTLNADTYGSSVLSAIGVDNVYDADGERYPTVTLDAVAALAPDVVVAPSEPYPFAERHRAELEQLAPAVLVDGQDLFWWGVRTEAAVERLRAQLGAA